VTFTPEQWLRFGTVIVFAWFAIQLVEKVFALIRVFATKGTRKGESDVDRIIAAIDKVEPKIRCLVDKVSDLHDWHNVKDPRTGTMVWYSGFQNSALQETLVEVSRTLQGITTVLKELATQQRENHGEQIRAIETATALGKETKTTLSKVQDEIRKRERT
jgi:hypothetical protein